MAPLSRRTVALSIVASFIAAALWAALAWRTPTNTFHFAPLVAAGVGPYVAKTRSGRLAPQAAGSIVMSCAVVVALAIAALAIGDRLRGPTFWSESGALGEAILFAVLGAGVGFSMLSSATTKQATP